MTTYYKHGNVEVRDATVEDAQQIGYNLRVKDLEEVLAEGCESGSFAVERSFENSVQRIAVCVDGSPAAIFGIVPDSMLGNSARVWFLGTEQMGRVKKTFVRLSRRFLPAFLTTYPVLWNVVDARYTESIRWLKSCGAKFRPEPIMYGEHPFLLFTMRRA